MSEQRKCDITGCGGVFYAYVTLAQGNGRPDPHIKVCKNHYDEAHPSRKVSGRQQQHTHERNPGVDDKGRHIESCPCGSTRYSELLGRYF